MLISMKLRSLSVKRPIANILMHYQWGIEVFYLLYQAIKLAGEKVYGS